MIKNYLLWWDSGNYSLALIKPYRKRKSRHENKALSVLENTDAEKATYVCARTCEV